MKKFYTIFLVSLILFSFAGCISKESTKNVIEDYNIPDSIILTADTNILVINNYEYAKLKAVVKNKNGETISNVEVKYFCNDEEFSGDSFKSNEEGDFTITAKCQNITSNKLIISVTPFELRENDDNNFEITDFKGYYSDVKIPEKVQDKKITSIGYCAFFNDLIKYVSIPNTVTKIGYESFANNYLNSVTIPDSVVYIDDGAFYNNRLYSVKLSNNLTHIGEAAFSNNDLDSITIPESVTFIGNGAFKYNQTDFKIYGKSGSYAETYAKENNITFIVK